MWYPLACEVVFACFMLAFEKGTRSPTTFGCLAVRESQGNAFCLPTALCSTFVCDVAVTVTALSSRCRHPNASARKSRCRISRFSGNRLVVGHVRDAGQRQERVLTSGCHQRLAQAQAVRDRHIVVGEPVGEHERAIKLRRVGDDAVAFVHGRVKAEIAFGVMRVVQRPVGRRRAAQAAANVSGASNTASAERNPPYDQPIMATRLRSGCGTLAAAFSPASASNASGNARTASIWSSSVTDFMVS